MCVFCKCLSIVIFLALLFSGKLLSLCNEKIQNSILGKQSFTAVLRAVLCFADIRLIIYIGFQKPVDAFILLATMLVFTAIWSILCVVGIVDERKVSAPKLDSQILKNAKKALTNGAGILSVISCYTTANGMKDVVFGGWLAYPASIAVQVTLAFLSFFLLRFIFAVKELQWPSLAKKITSCLLVLITTGYLTMSSLFSYSFIVTKAYEKTRTENNEAVARTYFTETATLLESENNLRGTSLYSALSNAINDADGLSLAIQTQKNVENEQLNSQVISNLAKVLNITVNVVIEQESNLGDLSSSERIQSAKTTLLQSNALLEGWVSNLTKALNDLKAIANKDPQTLSGDDYDTIKEHYNILYGSNGNSAENALNEVMSTISQIPSSNSKLKNHIQRTQNVIIDLKPKIDQLKQYLKSANDIVHQIASQQSQSTQNNSASTSIQAPEDILKRINEIQIKAEVSSTQEDAKNDLNDLLEDVDSWTASQNLTSQTVEKIRTFCEDLKEYRKYIELKQTLENFNETAIKKVYVVVSSEENEKTVGGLSYITEAKWMSARNENFYTLENSVALLPEYPAASDGQLENPSEENAAEISEIPSKAIQMQRILFAELTDVERAINYFGKEYTGYRKMAVFSVVMAVFFDLGAFISGNLVMLIEYFIKESPKDNDSAHSQQDKDQEKEMAQIH